LTSLDIVVLRCEEAATEKKGLRADGMQGGVFVCINFSEQPLDKAPDPFLPGTTPYKEKVFRFFAMQDRSQRFLTSHLMLSKRVTMKDVVAAVVYMCQRTFDKLLGTLLSFLRKVMRLTVREEADLSQISQEP
jgi:hypothetical protein